MQSQVLSSDPLAGIRRIHHFDESTGDTTIETVQDVEGIVDITKALHAGTDERARWNDPTGGALGVHVAEIPLSILFDPKNKHLLQDQEALRKWLDDSDNRHFRSRPGRLSK